MKVDSLLRPATFLAFADAAAAIAGPLKFNIRQRQNGALEREVLARASSTSIPIANSFVNFDLQWYANISVGTPGQQFTVLFDTGSNDIILTSSACTTATCAHHGLFDPSASSTFSPQPAVNVTIPFGTGGNSVPNGGSVSVSGTVVTDVVRLSGLSVANTTFLLSSNGIEALASAPGVDGIFGLGPPGTPSKFSTFSGDTNASAFSSFIWSLAESGDLPDPVFSIFLNSGKGSSDGELTLGGVDTSKYDGAIRVVDLNMTVSSRGGSWYADAPAFFVNGNAVTNSVSKSAFPAAQALMDTGTAFIQTPDFQTAKDIYAAIDPDIHQIDKLGAWGAPCETLEKLNPEFTFTIGNGGQAFNMTVPNGTFNLGPYPNMTNICQALFLNPVQPVSTEATIWTLGSPLLKGYYTIWNGSNPENLKLGVASLKADLTTGGNTPTNTSDPSASDTPNAGSFVGGSIKLLSFVASATVFVVFLL